MSTRMHDSEIIFAEHALDRVDQARSILAASALYARVDAPHRAR